MNRLYKGIKLLIKEPKEFIIVLNKLGIYNWMPDSTFLKFTYWLHFGKKLNLKSPKTYNEKLQWLKLYDRNPAYTEYADKYLVRNYVKKTIGEKYLVPLIDVYDTVDDIDWNSLPERFVLKCNHASGRNIICGNKEQLNISAARVKLSKWLKRNFFWHGREWVYKNIKPKIIAEKFLEDDTGALLDYKFMCFNGTVKCILVCSGRNTGKGLKMDFYDMNWEHMPFERQYKNSGQTIFKPICFDKMVELAQKLSEGIPYVRVDMYEVNGNIYFGEMTFYPANGMSEFSPEFYDELLGSWISLPEVS